MSRLTLTIASFLFAICSLLPLAAQQSSSPATSATAVVPSITRFSGTLSDLNGKPLTGITGVTFSLYKDEQGGAPLWMETQNVTSDKTGRYSVVLGSTTATGLPANLFASGEARWMGIRAEGQNENPRVLLVSVPYALKAADAETLGGLPASAFLQAASGSSNAVTHTASAAAVGTASPTGSGTTGFVPLWTSATQLGNSRIFQGSGGVGIGTMTAGFALDVNGKINSAQGFYLGGNPFAFGSNSSKNVFFGFSGNLIAGSLENTALGWHALQVLTLGGSNTAMGGQALTDTTTGSQNSAFGAAALFANTTGVDNTALGWEGLFQNTTGSYNTAVGDGAIYTNSTGSYNIGIGYNSGTVGAGTTGGSGNTFVGALSGPNGISNLSNATAIGYKAQVGVSNALVLGQSGTLVGIGTSMPTNPLTIQADDNGQGRGGVPHQLQIQGASNPNKQLLIGYLADNLSDAGYGTIQATESGIRNTWLSLQPVGGTVAIAEAVPITGAPLEIARDNGNAVADGWATYSSRRWKTNIETLHGALGKVEKLRGVSYDLKSNGKHEIGVIAEEVGAVIPEIVQWEKNGKDAESVDYTRMVALLIEGMKEQQALIHKQQALIRVEQRLVKAQQAQITRLSSHVKTIESSLSLGQQAVAEVRTAASIR
jgi:hypothetical protein